MEITAHTAASRALERSARHGALDQVRSGSGEDGQASDPRAAGPRYADAPPGTRESRPATAGMLAARAGSLRGLDGAIPAAAPTEVRARAHPRRSHTAARTNGSTHQTGDRRADLRCTPTRRPAGARTASLPRQPMSNVETGKRGG